MLIEVHIIQNHAPSNLNRDDSGSPKSAIFGGNSARLYRLPPRTAQHGITTDKIALLKEEYLAAGGARTNARYGYVARTTA